MRVGKECPIDWTPDTDLRHRTIRLVQREWTLHTIHACIAEIQDLLRCTTYVAEDMPDKQFRERNIYIHEDLIRYLGEIAARYAKSLRQLCAMDTSKRHQTQWIMAKT